MVNQKSIRSISFCILVAMALACGNTSAKPVVQESYSFALDPTSSEILLGKNGLVVRIDSTHDGKETPSKISGLNVEVMNDGTIFTSASEESVFPLTAIGPSKDWISELPTDRFLSQAVPRIGTPELWAVRSLSEKDTTTLGKFFVENKIVRLTKGKKEIPLQMRTFDFLDLWAGCETKRYLFFSASENFGIDQCLWRCNLDGSNLKQLTKEGFSIRATANSKSGQIAYANNSKQTANWSIVLADENGEKSRTIEMGKIEVGQIRFTNSGKSLLALARDGTEVSLLEFDVTTLEKRLIRRLK